MKQKLAFVHTVPSLVGLFNELSRELLPDVEVFHIADEMLLKVVLAQGGLSPFIYQRVPKHVVAAEHAGATAVQCTCSSISPCVEASRPLVGVPVLKIDEPMVDAAIRTGSRIGMLPLLRLPSSPRLNWCMRARRPWVYLCRSNPFCVKARTGTVLRRSAEA